MFVVIGQIKAPYQIMSIIIDMTKKLLLLSFLCSFAKMYGQYTDIINSNRPGYSESPYSVGLGVYQFEAGLFLNSSENNKTYHSSKSFGTNFIFRTSFFKEKFEINTQLSLQRDQTTFTDLSEEKYTNVGLSKFLVGAKYLLYEQTYDDKTKEIRSWKRRHAFDWKRLIPSISLYAGVNTNFVGEAYKKEKMTPKVGLLLQNNLSASLNVVSNIFYDAIGDEYAELVYLFTGTYIFQRNWSAFAEYKGSNNNFRTAHDFGIGLAYLFNRNVQIDAAARIHQNGNNSEKYAAIGFSYRLDRHVVPFIELDGQGSHMKSMQTDPRGNKNFFGRTKDKFLNFFKFKKRKSSKGKVSKKANSRERPVRKRKKSIAKKNEENKQQEQKKKKKKKKAGTLFKFLKKTKPKTKKKNKSEDDSTTSNHL